MRIWFNKTFSTIAGVMDNLRQAYPTGALTLICTHVHGGASAFLAADEAYLEPHLTDAAYLDWCLKFCREQRIELFWPGKEAVLISQHQERFQELGTQVMAVSDHETLALLHNKARFYTELRPEVAQTMEFVPVNTAAEFDAAVAELSQRHERLCVKPSVSVYGLGFRILDTGRDSISQLLKGMEHHIPLAELRQGMENTPSFDTLLVMEHLGGVEWSVDCAGRHGELLCAVQRKKSPKAGYGQTIDNNPDIAGMVERLTAAYRLNGIFNVQFKEGSAGPRLLEINPRPSGGFGMACLSGANPAYIALQAFKNESFTPPVIQYGLRISEVNRPVILPG